MDIQLLKEKIHLLEPDILIRDQEKIPGMDVPAGKWHEVADLLKNDPAFDLDFLMCVTGVDWGMELGVVYHFYSTRHNHKLVARVKTSDRENPEIPTVSDIWRTAEFQEREVFDLFGIRFTGHPDLRRIFLEDDWKGFPLRKDYKDEVNIIER